MNALYAAAREFVRDDDGITAIEYGLIAALMATAVGTGIGYLGPDLTAKFKAIGTTITNS